MLRRKWFLSLNILKHLCTLVNDFLLLEALHLILYPFPFSYGITPTWTWWDPVTPLLCLLLSLVSTIGLWSKEEGGAAMCISCVKIWLVWKDCGETWRMPTQSTAMQVREVHVSWPKCEMNEAKPSRADHYPQEIKSSENGNGMKLNATKMVMDDRW